MRITLLATPDPIHTRRWIAWLAGRGHELTLVTDAYTKQRPSQCKILLPRWNLATKILAFRLTPKPYGNERWKHLHMRPLVRQSRPDIVHGFEALHYGYTLSMCGPYPRVLTPWGRDVHHKANQGPRARWLVERALAGADAISTNDETLPDYLETHFGVERAKVRAFSWGVDPGVFRPGLTEDAEAWRHELQIPANAPVILSPRHFLPYWGSELLSEAIPGALEAIPGAIFVILRGASNEGFDEASVKRLEANFGASVRFVSRAVSPEEMAGLLNLARAFVSVPKTDLLAQTITEGMACGCLPVLAPHAPYRKHARPSENCVMLDGYTPEALTRSLIEALRNDELTARAHAENPALMQRHENWKVNAAKMEDVYALAKERFDSRKK